MAVIDRQYTTVALINSFLRKTITDDLSPYILATQRFIENFTGRIFASELSDSTRLFNGKGGNELIIDDCASISKVEISNDGWGDNFTEVVIGDYKTLPVDNVLPIRKIVLRYDVFGKGVSNVRITGKWGWKELPQDISFCATVLASGMYNANDNSTSLKSESIGGYSVSYGDKDWEDFDKVKRILKSYENIEI